MYIRCLRNTQGNDLPTAGHSSPTPLSWPWSHHILVLQADCHNLLVDLFSPGAQASDLRVSRIWSQISARLNQFCLVPLMWPCLQSPQVCLLFLLLCTSPASHITWPFEFVSPAFTRSGTLSVFLSDHRIACQRTGAQLMYVVE